MLNCYTLFIYFFTFALPTDLRRSIWSFFIRTCR